jgi:predicted ATPase/class 3 adenylate cyclase
MPELPRGVVTFLFTDVEGSTRMVRELGDAGWAELLQEHRTILRSAVSAHNGTEFGTQGDAVFVAFASALDAACAAVAAQQAMEDNDWPAERRVRIRLGLHSGEALVHAGNYVGKEVHRAARICDVGHGGQIVVSERTAALLRGNLHTQFALTGLGAHRLKDMGDAEPLFQLTAPGLPSQFAPLRSLDSPSNLPAMRSSFVGRERLLADAQRLLASHRLVTMTGIGGSGKTRLSIEVGSRERSRFADGVFFVDLARLADPDLVCEAVAVACSAMIGDIRQGNLGSALEDRLLTALASRSCLLIVDNCEHLIDSAADTIDAILGACPKVCLLATSREGLGLEGEQVMPVPPLSVPAPQAETSAAEHNEAVLLFVDRAQSVQPGFALDGANREAVVEVCRRLDGIPLAIELAATRVAHLSPEQIAERLEDRFRLLTGGRRRIQRQQTLGATLDWSHDLLDEKERAMLRRLAVFAGGFNLEAVEDIAGASSGPAFDSVALLGALVAKSLVVTAEGEDGQIRYQLLETVRLYAADKLAAAGEAEELRSRHRDYYLQWLEAIPVERLSASSGVLRVVASEIDNLRAAADWCTARRDFRELARLAIHLGAYWAFGAYREGRQWYSRALETPDSLTDELRLACHANLARLCGTSLDREAGCAHATKVVELARGRTSPYLALAYGQRGFMNTILASAPGQPASLADDARRDCAAAVETALDGLDTEWVVQTRLLWAMAECVLDDQRAAAHYYTEVLDAIRSADERHAMLDQVLAGLAVSRHLLGETDAATDAAMEGLALDTTVPIPSYEGVFYRVELAPALAAGGHADFARELLRDEIARVRRVGVPLAENHVLGVVGVVEYLRGDFYRAARLMAASRRLGGARGSEIPFRTPGSVSLYRHYMPRVREELGREQARRAREAGQAMTVGAALTYALEGLA